MRRFLQVIKYGWKHSGEACKGKVKWIRRIGIFFDILVCFFRYRMWSNQYMKEKMYLLKQGEKEEIGKKYREKNAVRDKWQKEFQRNLKFYLKYSSKKYDHLWYREKRNAAYQKQYHMGKNPFVNYDVEISRRHQLSGTIKIGDNVKISKHVLIDYSGDVIIEDNVVIAAGCRIYSHKHPMFAMVKEEGKSAIPVRTVIKKGAELFSSSIIMPGVTIGEYATVYSGAVVIEDVEPYGIVVGNPARDIRDVMQERGKKDERIGVSI